jgi:hypothetical protein
LPRGGFARPERSHSCFVIPRVGKGGIDMKYVLLIYQGTAPLPGSDRWKAPTEAEQKAIYSDRATINKAAGVTPGLPLGLSTPATPEGAPEAYDED